MVALQKADDQVGIGDFHAIDRDERHLSTRRIANALLGDGFEGDSLETKMSCQLRRKRRQRRDPARDVGIENAEAVQSHDSRRSKMDLIVHSREQTRPKAAAPPVVSGARGISGIVETMIIG